MRCVGMGRGGVGRGGTQLAAQLVVRSRKRESVATIGKCGWCCMTVPHLTQAAIRRASNGAPSVEWDVPLPSPCTSC